MKRVLVLVVIGLLLATSAFGVDLKVGPKVGVGHTMARGDDWDEILDDSDGDNALGFTFLVGAFVEIGVTPALAVQPEILLSVGGSTLKFDGSPVYDENTKLSFKARLLNIPVLLKGKFDAGPVGVSVFAGPQLQLRLGDWPLKSNDSDFEDDLEAFLGFDEITDFETDFGIAATAGAGVVLGGLGPGELSIEGRFVYGFAEFIEDSDVKFSTILLTLGYGIGL
jgi:hypothetical protein